MHFCQWASGGKKGYVHKHLKKRRRFVSLFLSTAKRIRSGEDRKTKMVRKHSQPDIKTDMGSMSDRLINKTKEAKECKTGKTKMTNEIERD